ncbi:hypothetical protein ACFQO4_20750 [Saliphagus sp. GCM10025334]
MDEELAGDLRPVALAIFGALIGLSGVRVAASPFPYTVSDRGIVHLMWNASLSMILLLGAGMMVAGVAWLLIQGVNDFLEIRAEYE